MVAMTDGYPFFFVMNDRDCTDEKLEYTLQYRFKSSKSHRTYIVRLEKYLNHAYCVKFFDKSVSESKNKFSIRTNTFEVRTILYTLYHIMLDVLNKDNLASFFFIGAEDEKDELGESTRRYRLYRRFVGSAISDRAFAHYRVNELSLYILVNRQNMENVEGLISDIVDGVRQAFPHNRME